MLLKVIARFVHCESILILLTRAMVDTVTYCDYVLLEILVACPALA